MLSQQSIQDDVIDDMSPMRLGDDESGGAMRTPRAVHRTEPYKQGKGRSLRSRNWCWTIPNPVQAHYDMLDNLIKSDDEAMPIVIAAVETGDGGLVHIQGACTTKNLMTMQGMLGRLNAGIVGSVHIEMMEGTINDSKTYILDGHNGKKPIPTRTWKKGVIPPGRGSRSDIDEVRQMITEGRNLRYIWQNATSYQVACINAC